MVEAKKKYSLAENMYRRALAVDGERVEVLGRYGRLQHLALHDPDAARRTFEQALDLDPRNVDALFHMGLLAQDVEKDYQKAKHFYLAALEESAREPRVLAAYGHLLARHLANYHLGLFLVRKAVALDPANDSIKSVLNALTLRNSGLKDLLFATINCDDDDETCGAIKRIRNTIAVQSVPAARWIAFDWPARNPTLCSDTF